MSIEANIIAPLMNSVEDSLSDSLDIIEQIRNEIHTPWSDSDD